MEVHAHSHTERKKFTHYLWEFLMLFLAVTLGFFVENQREHMIEHKREKQFMVSLREDLTEDIGILSKQIADGDIDIIQMDSLMFYLNNTISKNQNSRIYFWGRLASRHAIFNYNNRTIDQMRNSGAFRLIQKQQVSNRIMGYYRQIKLLEMLEGIEKEEEHEYRKLAVKVFDPLIFNSMGTIKDSIISPIGNSPLRTSDQALLADLSGWIQYIKSSVQGLTEFKKGLKRSAEDLIQLIRNEYHLK